MFQQIILVGNLGRDPEMRYTPSGVPVTNFSIATNRRWNNQNGQKMEKTTWFRVTAWRKTGEIASQYLSKGRTVMVVGEMEEPSVWKDKSGEHHASLEVTIRQLVFLPGGGDSVATTVNVPQDEAKASQAPAPKNGEDLAPWDTGEPNFGMN